MIEIGYSREHNLVMARAQGRITLSELIKFHDDMDRLNVSANYRSLADYRRADLSDLSAADIKLSKQRGNEVAVHAGGNDRFELVVSQPLEFGLGRMYQMIDERDELSMKVFRNFDDAIEWLEVERETIDLLSAPFQESKKQKLQTADSPDD